MRSLAMQQRDRLDYRIARDLGMPLHAVRALPSSEVAEWAALVRVERWEAERGG